MKTEEGFIKEDRLAWLKTYADAGVDPYEHDPVLLHCDCPKCKKLESPAPVVTPATRLRDQAMRLRSEELQKKEDEKVVRDRLKTAKAERVRERLTAKQSKQDKVGSDRLKKKKSSTTTTEKG